MNDSFVWNAMDTWAYLGINLFGATKGLHCLYNCLFKFQSLISANESS